MWPKALFWSEFQNHALLLLCFVLWNLLLLFSLFQQSPNEENFLFCVIFPKKSNFLTFSKRLNRFSGEQVFSVLSRLFPCILYVCWRFAMKTNELWPLMCRDGGFYAQRSHTSLSNGFVNARVVAIWFIPSTNAPCMPKKYVHPNDRLALEWRRPFFIFGNKVPVSASQSSQFGLCPDAPQQSPQLKSDLVGFALWVGVARMSLEDKVSTNFCLQKFRFPWRKKKEREHT